MRVAVIGIGSNSLRMLIADIDLKNAKFHRVASDREGLRVFAALDANRNISREMTVRACECVCTMIAKARAYTVKNIHIFATSAVRDAANREEFCSHIFAVTEIMPKICSGELEAKLSFLGATEAGPSGMIDIGGGSTEVVIGDCEEIQMSTSLQIGAVRLFRKMPIHKVDDAYQVMAHIKAALAKGSSSHRIPQNLAWVGVGGTLTTIAALEQNIPWTNKSAIHGFSLTREAVRKNMERLAAMEMGIRARLKGLQRERADIIVHGLVILLACMEEFQIDAITVSEYGNLEGFLKYYYF